MLAEREVVGDGVQRALYDYTFARHDACVVYHRRRVYMLHCKKLTKIMSLGPRLWLLAHFDLAVGLQMRGHHPNFAVCVAAVELTTAHLIVERDGVDPSRSRSCG